MGRWRLLPRSLHRRQAVGAARSSVGDQLWHFSFPCGTNGYECRGTAKPGKPCLFIHGAGLNGPTRKVEVQPVSPATMHSFLSATPYYWGAHARALVSRASPCDAEVYEGNYTSLMEGLCSTVRYIYTDTQ